MQAKSYFQCPSRSGASPRAHQALDWGPAAHLTGPSGPAVAASRFSFVQHFCWGQQHLQGSPGLRGRHFSVDCQQGLSGLISFVPFFLVLRRGQAVSHVSLGLLAKDNPPLLW